ncbi:hypothetical protein CBR_g46728 [Chara braunii]|uniref:Lysine--tRNA ligase n=1 Tax=Chara braunii TaxID=69332 RepID=A0A388K3Y4_CHABU|nr:hypothetical protein CBR_g46728 [Chara braunii]|eukprot:GBG64772.1 hypothetical protein CBR_g46728 [Chara braunii]
MSVVRLPARCCASMSALSVIPAEITGLRCRPLIKSLRGRRRYFPCVGGISAAREPPLLAWSSRKSFFGGSSSRATTGKVLAGESVEVAMRSSNSAFPAQTSSSPMLVPLTCRSGTGLCNSMTGYCARETTWLRGTATCAIPPRNAGKVAMEMSGGGGGGGCETAQVAVDDVASNQQSERRRASSRQRGAGGGDGRGRGGGGGGGGVRGGGGAIGGSVDSTSSREDVRAIRLKKVEELRAEGVDPFAYNFARTHLAAELQDKYRDLDNAAEAAGETDHVAVAGRIVARRVFGKLAFLTIKDDSGTIQLYCEKQRLDDSAAGPDAFARIKGVLDVGDIIGAQGTLKRTEKGELSVVIKQYKLLTKSLLPLPDKWHGLTDVEKRYRQRYVDLIVNPGVADVFRTRAKITSVLRKFLEERGFLEIETPVLQGSAGGADARPFITHHNALGRDMYLRIATELHLKRMVVGGFERVFEIGRIFRNEGISTRHNPEFTSVEVYQAYADYFDMMDLTEEVVRSCALAACGGLDITYQGVQIDLSIPWRRATMHDLVREVTGVDFSAFGDDDVALARSAAAQALGRSTSTSVSALFADCPSVGHVLNELFEQAVEQTLIQPTFVLDHPIEISPLAKPHRSRRGVVERFELFIYGREMANAFSELTDPIDQRRRLERQVLAHNQKVVEAAEKAKSKAGEMGEEEERGSEDGKKKDGGREGMQEEEKKEEEEEEDAYEVKMDDDFVTALEYGMPPTAGMGLGIDRLVMLLTDSASIRDVIAFPILKVP